MQLISFHVYFLGYLPHIINMGQTKSKECADKRGTYNLSAQVAVNDIDILRRLAENEGPIAVSAYIDESLNRWKNEQVKFAITGRRATGKSTFNNEIRNKKGRRLWFCKGKTREYDENANVMYASDK